MGYKRESGIEAEGKALMPKSLAFGGVRTCLRVEEVADKLGVSARHVVSLIEGGRIRALNLGAGGSVGRRYYRIPVEAWEAYVVENLV